MRQVAPELVGDGMQVLALGIDAGAANTYEELGGAAEAGCDVEDLDEDELEEDWWRTRGRPDLPGDVLPWHRMQHART